ncbi:MAG: L,D-transpeptidase family protein [Pseudomonadota bacterium]
MKRAVRFRLFVAGLLYLMAGGLATAQVLPAPGPYHQLLGDVQIHRVERGDSLSSLGARFGLAPSVLARDNGLKTDAKLKPGTELLIDNRHIVPLRSATIIINIPQRMVFVLQDGEAVAGYPVGLGKPDWQTPTGPFRVVVKEENPTWDVPKSIQEEMRREGKVVKTKVPPGPDNPLGAYWIGLNRPGYGLHGTIAPLTVYTFSSHGCIRLHNDDIADLFGWVERGTTGQLIYEPVLLARLPDGRVFLEVHRDVYKKGINLAREAARLIRQYQLQDQVDWDRVNQAILKKQGRAVLISPDPLGPSPIPNATEAHG